MFVSASEGEVGEAGVAVEEVVPLALALLEGGVVTETHGSSRSEDKAGLL